MEKTNNEPDKSKHKPLSDDLISEVKRLIEDDDPSVSVEEFIPPPPSKKAELLNLRNWLQ